MQKIYLDHGATTPVDKKVLKAMLPYFSEKYGNASSLHNFGEVAGEAVEKARKITTDFFGADPKEIILTSGATESNNLAIKGVVKAYYKNTRANSREMSPGAQITRPHIITTSFEHHCVLEACHAMETEGLAEVTYIKPDQNGLISAADVKAAIKPTTILISIMYVNNEIGTVQPIAEIGKLIKAWNAKRGTRNVERETGSKLRDTSYAIIFHTDATQAVNYLDCNINKLGVDLLSMSAHKIYGPKGIGALYVRKGTSIKRVQDGGEQEFSLRAGTLNVPGIVGLGAAISIIKKQRTANNKKLLGLRNYLIQKVLKEIPDARLNGSKIKRSPNNINFSFSNVEGESLVLMLAAEGIAASTGSACSSGSLEPSHVLLAIGLKPEQAHGSLRITLGKHNTQKEIDIFITKLKKIVEQLRKVSGNVLEDYYRQN
jgi:cysteine desulfurase